MSKNNRKYWRQRAVNFENEWTNRCQETVEKQLARYYQKSLVAIKKDILQLYATFASDNGIDYNEAKRMLGSREIKEWRMGLQDYLQQIANGEKGFQTELNTLAMRPRISRLEKLYSETMQEMDKLGRDVKGSMKDFLSNAYKENYCRDIFDLVKIGGMQVALAKIDALSVEKVLATRWSGKNYSQRIWKNTKLLSNAVKQTITSGVHRGLSIQQMSRNLEDKMQSGYRNAVLLVRTEMNFVNNQAHADSMKDAGIEMYGVLRKEKLDAALDTRINIGKNLLSMALKRV